MPAAPDLAALFPIPRCDPWRCGISSPPRGLTQYRRVTILENADAEGTGPQRRSTAILRQNGRPSNRTLEVLK